jgi:hypothetical protein
MPDPVGRLVAVAAALLVPRGTPAPALAADLVGGFWIDEGGLLADPVFCGNLLIELVGFLFAAATDLAVAPIAGFFEGGAGKAFC